MARESLAEERKVAVKQCGDVFRRSWDPIFFQHHSRDESVGCTGDGNSAQVLLNAEAFLHGIEQRPLTSSA
jgi:hypothetical protein